MNAMVQVWHSANWEARTALRFTVDLDSVDIVQVLLHYGVGVDWMSISSCTNAGLLKLLRVAGNSSYSTIETHYSEGIEGGSRVKRYMLRSLSDQCRRVIRKHLLEVNLQASLFRSVRYLSLPILLEKYLVFGETLKCPGILRGQSEGLCEQMLVFLKNIPDPEV